MAERKGLLGRGIVALVLLGVVAGGVLIGWIFWTANRAVFDLLLQNRELRKAIANLTHEDQIAYVKLVSQTERDGRLWTRIQFAETQRDDPRKIVLQKEFEVEGDVIYFDALVITFDPQWVQDGNARSLYLWRRVFGEKMAPASGFAIEEAGSEPARYKEVFSQIPRRDRSLFWDEVWNLAHDPDRLLKAHIRAVHGKAVYQKILPGFIYVFKLGNTGQMTVDTLKAL